MNVFLLFLLWFATHEPAYAQSCSRLYTGLRLAVDLPESLLPPTKADIELIEREVGRLRSLYGKRGGGSGVEASLFSLLARNNRIAAKPKSVFGTLTEVERYVMGEYVEWGYQNFNRLLETGKIQILKKEWGNEPDIPTLAKVRILAAALKKLPSYEGTVLRGEVYASANSLPELRRKLARLKTGHVFLSKSFLSTSATRDAIAEDQYGKLVIQFRIKSKNGKYIGPMSSRPSEEEVLFGPYTQFLVTDVQKIKIKPSEVSPKPELDYRYVVEMEEI